MASRSWQRLRNQNRGKLGLFIRTFKIFLVSPSATQLCELKSETLQNISDLYMHAFARLLILMKQKLKREMLKNEAISNHAK
jgi:hypothetical protein